MIAWIAIFAMLCHALMPTIAQARASRDVTSILSLALCSAAGTSAFALDVDASKSSSSQSVLAAHCPYCTGTPHFALPPLDWSAWGIEPSVTRVYAPRVATPAVKLGQFVSAPPRGPPCYA